MNLNDIIAWTKGNANISDAHYWGYYTLCGMLMRLRELYRHESSLPPWGTIDTHLITPWITDREKLWAELEDADFQDILLDGHRYGPYDIKEINTLLAPHSLVYGAGQGLYRKPAFFLGQLLNRTEEHGCVVNYVDKEFCRDIGASVAMLQGKTIYVRLEPLGVLLYEKIVESRGRKSLTTFRDALACYGMEKDAVEETQAFEERFKEMVLHVSRIVTCHELGEALEEEEEPSQETANPWLTLLCGSTDRFTELYLRGIKDLLADTSPYGPLRLIIRERDKGLLYFYGALLDSIRKELFPEIIKAITGFHQKEDWGAVERAQTAGYERGKALRGEILRLYRRTQTFEAIGAHITACLKSLKEAP